jgi:hypothetical protein
VKVTANATRSGDWSAIDVPEIPGLFTQAKRLEQVADVVSDTAATLGKEIDDVQIVPVPDVAALPWAPPRPSAATSNTFAAPPSASAT